jgi:hypothetical protein
MNKTCTLIKNSELAELRNVVSNCNDLIKQSVENETVQLRNDISEKDKEISELKKEIEDMKNNPQIDPMKLEIIVERQINSVGSGGKLRDVVINRYNVIEPVNFDLSDKLQKQIQNIVDIYTRRDRRITLEDIDVAAEVKFSRIKQNFEDYTIFNFSEKGYFERKKIVKEIKGRRNEKATFNKNGTPEFN